MKSDNEQNKRRDYQKRDYDLDYKRVAELLYNGDVQNDIIDEETFDESYNEYFSEEEHLRKNEIFRKGVLRKFRKLNPIPASIHREAGGKSFERDRRTTAKTVVTSRKEYKKRGASNVDLKGYDTKNEFKFMKRSGTRRVVRARPVNVTVRGKQVQRFRDQMGRFTRN